MLIYLVLCFASSLIIWTLPWLLCFKSKSGKSENRIGTPKGGYKPGHLPEFADPDVKECNTFYDVNSLQAFPPKEELPPTPAVAPAKQSTNNNNNNITNGEPVAAKETKEPPKPAT